jgi:hypothetical protein
MCMSNASMTESCHLIWSDLCMIRAKHIDVRATVDGNHDSAYGTTPS